MWCLHLGDGSHATKKMKLTVPGIWRWEQVSMRSYPPKGIPVSLTMIPIGNHILIEGFVDKDESFLFDTSMCHLLVTFVRSWLSVSLKWESLAAEVAANSANYGRAIFLSGNVYYMTGYRYNTHSGDVIKVCLSTSPLLIYPTASSCGPSWVYWNGCCAWLHEESNSELWCRDGRRGRTDSEEGWNGRRAGKASAGADSVIHSLSILKYFNCTFSTIRHFQGKGE